MKHPVTVDFIFTCSRKISLKIMGPVGVHYPREYLLAPVLTKWGERVDLSQGARQGDDFKP